MFAKLKTETSEKLREKLFVFSDIVPRLQSRDLWKNLTKARGQRFRKSHLKRRKETC